MTEETSDQAQPEEPPPESQPEPVPEAPPQSSAKQPEAPPQPSKTPAEPDAPDAADTSPNDRGVLHGFADFANARPNGEAGGPDQSWNGKADEAERGPDPTYGTNIRGGVTTIGDGGTTYVYNLRNGREVTILRFHRSVEWLAKAETTFVTPANFQDCYQRLTDNHVLYLRGAPGSGRRRLAEILLKTVVGPERVLGLQVNQNDVPLAVLAGEKDLLADAKGHGVVLELAAVGAVAPATLATLATMAAETFIVVLGDGTATLDQSLHPYDAVVEPVDAEAVFRAHLGCELNDRAERGQPLVDSHPEAFVQRCLRREEVRARLAADPQPGSVADLARVLAAWDGTDENLGRVLNKIRARVRELAARLVKGDGEPTAAGSPATPRRQAVQIAHAAFDGHSFADVFDVGQLLLDILHGLQDGETPTTRAVFDADIDHMLRLPDGTVVIDLDAGGHPRRAHFLDPGFAAEVLDVVWNDFDNIRLPLLFWLDRLVRNGKAGIRRRAAYVAGGLAAEDFEQVWRLLIRPWAGAASGAVRQAAAWAVDALASDGRLLWLVRAMVRDWTRSRDPQLHDAAARSYGTTLGTKFVGDALADLDLLACRDDLNQSASVAYAIRFLYPGAPEEIRTALVRWNEEEIYRMRVHAARALILLSRLTAPAPRQQWPRLLADIDTAENSEVLIDLWRAALTDPTTMRRAWQELHTWLRWADADPDLEDRVAALGRQILAAHTDERGGRILPQRGRFYLRQWRSECATAARLYTELWPDTPGDLT